MCLTVAAVHIAKNRNDQPCNAWPSITKNLTANSGYKGSSADLKILYTLDNILENLVKIALL